MPKVIARKVVIVRGHEKFDIERKIQVFKF